MIWCWWYFSDEADGKVGPFRTKQDAKEAAKIYGIGLHRELTIEEEDRFRVLLVEDYEP